MRANPSAASSSTELAQLRRPLSRTAHCRYGAELSRGRRSGSAAPGEKAVVFKAGFSVGERGACQRFDAASSGLENSLPGSGVPLHRRAETRVEVSLTGGDDAEFQGTATALARPHGIILQELGKSPAVLVRPAVDDDEPVLRCACVDQLWRATTAAACRGARTVRGIGQTDSRPMYDTEHRPSFLDKRDQHRELAAPGDELASTVERVDRPEAITARRHSLGLAQFLGDARNVGEGRHEPVEDDPLGREIGFGHRGLVGLMMDVEFFGIDLEDGLAGGDRRPAYDFEHFLTIGGHAACRGWAAWIACQTRSGISGMSRCAMLSSPSASTTALTRAGGAPIAPASPAPLTPSGLVRHGTML